MSNQKHSASCYQDAGTGAEKTGNPQQKKAQPQKRRHPLRKSIKSSTAVKPPESDDDKDNED